MLGLVTALIVARPLVAGEDPGLLHPISHPSSLLLTVLWLLAAAGWAAWRFWSGRPWRGSWVEVGLLATLGCVVLSAAVAAQYKHPAWLICWEWLVLLLAFCLVRQLAIAPGDNRGLLAALLATGVTLSAYAVYQYTVEFPRDREEFRDPERLRQALAQQNVFFDDESVIHLPEDAAASLGTAVHTGFPANLPWGPLLLAQQPNAAERDIRLARWEERIQANNAFATYGHPNSFAGFLALLLPAAFGIAWAGGRGAAATFRYGPLLAAGWAALLAVALWLTHSRGALLGVLVAALALAGVLGRSFLRQYKLWIALGGILLLAAGWWMWTSGWVESVLGKGSQTSARRLEYWSITWAVIKDHPWLGVGPGNFGQTYPRYMPASAFEKLQDPHNFVLEMWATAGVLAALALLAALAAFFAYIWKAQSWMNQEPSAEDTPESLARLPWEFYLGGSTGIILAFVMRASTLAPESMPLEGMATAGRSIIWFIAVAVFNGILWRGPTRPLVLAAGVLALLVNLCVSGGIGLPSVAQPLWVLAALALNTASPTSTAPRPKENWLWNAVPVPVFAVVWLVYMVFVYGPVTNAADAVSKARAAYLGWTARDSMREAFARVLQDMETLVNKDPSNALAAVQVALRDDPKWPDPGLVRVLRNRLVEALKRDPKNALGMLGSGRVQLQEMRVKDLEAAIIRHLETAVKQDPGNAAWLVELSHWEGERWKLLPGDKQLADQAMKRAEEACAIDPAGKEGHLARYRLRRLFARTLLKAGNPRPAAEQYGLAAKAFEEVIKRDPNDARLRYEHADLLFAAGDTVQARVAADAALERDRLAVEAGRRLTDRQRRQVQHWLPQPGEK